MGPHVMFGVATVFCRKFLFCVLHFILYLDWTFFYFSEDSYIHKVVRLSPLFDNAQPDALGIGRIYSRIFVIPSLASVGSENKLLPPQDDSESSSSKSDSDSDSGGDGPDPWFDQPEENHFDEGLDEHESEPEDQNQNVEPMDQDSRDDEVLDMSIPYVTDDDVDADDEGNDSDYRPDADCAIEYLANELPVRRWDEVSSGDEEDEWNTSAPHLDTASQPITNQQTNDSDSCITATEEESTNATTEATTFLTAVESFPSIRQSLNASARGMSRLDISEKSPYFANKSRKTPARDKTDDDRSRSPLKRVPTSVTFNPLIQSTPKPKSKPKPQEEQTDEPMEEEGVPMAQPTPGPSSSSYQPESFQLFLEDSSTNASNQQTSVLFEVEMMKATSRLASHSTIISCTNPGGHLCWFNASITGAQHGINLWNIHNGERMEEQRQSKLLLASTFDDLLLHMSRCNGKYQVDPTPMVQAFASQYHDNSEDILNEYQSPEEQFFQALLFQGGEVGSTLSNLMMSKISFKEIRDPCGCTTPPPKHEIVPKILPTPIFKFDFPGTQDTFSMMFSDLEYEVEGMTCNRLLARYDEVDENGAQVLDKDGNPKIVEVHCPDHINRTRTREFTFLSDIILIQVNRDLYSGTKENYRRHRHSKKIDLQANATIEIPLPNEAKERYSLFACLQHIGSFKSGHYVCHIKTSNNFVCVDDANPLKMSHLVKGNIDPEKSYLFMYIKESAAAGPSTISPSTLPVPRLVVPMDQETSSNRSVERPSGNLLSLSTLEKEIIHEDEEDNSSDVCYIIGNKQARKQAKVSSIYDSLYFWPFISRKVSHQDWFIYPISAMIVCMQESNISSDFALPSSSTRKNSLFTFFKDLYNSRPKDVVDASPILEKLAKLQGYKGLSSGSFPIIQLFRLDVVQDRTNCPWKSLIPDVSALTHLTSCLEHSSKEYGRGVKPANFSPLTLEVKSIPKKGKVQIQGLIKKAMNLTRRVKCDATGCKNFGSHITEFEINMAEDGIILYLEKTAKTGKKQKEYKNQLNDLTEPFHHCEDVISFPSSSENQTISYQFCAGVRQDATGKCILFFKFENRFFQLYDCDKVKPALREDLGLCTLLFYTLKKEERSQTNFSNLMAELSSGSDSDY